jgi:hypothetical protein
MLHPAIRHWSLVLCALPAGLLCTAAAADDMQRGVDLPLYAGVPFNMTQLNASLAQFKADGGQYVSVNVWWFQDTPTSTIIAPSTANGAFSVPDSEVVSVLQAIHNAGLQSALKPIVDATAYTQTAPWRGYLPGGNAWFTGPNNNGYTNFVTHYATMAAQNNVSLFVVGTELASTQWDTADWVNTINSVKATGFTGKLTYGANWNSGSSVIWNPVPWWSSLDYIGIDAYYPLSSKTHPTQADENAAWAAQATLINNWWNALPADQQKNILFTEVGYTNNYPDAQTQAYCYQALLSTLWGKEPWFKGVYWWDWTPNNPPFNYDNLVFQGQPAEQVMATYYSAPEPSTLAVGLLAMTLWTLSPRRRRRIGQQ